ncbi:MAG: hypothetical protein IPN29_12230 [Saprospiraceae bacterium]|nr:hypothetical protein [Saprospiraceae bacterium]
MQFYACKSTKVLNEGESLVSELKVNIDDSAGNIDKSAMKTELNYFVRQQKNGKFLFIPLEYIYFKTSEPGDSSKVNNWIRTRFGEKPSIHDSTQTLESANAMEQYLKYKKGYYHADVTQKILTRKKKTKVEYIVSPGQGTKCNLWNIIVKILCC